MGEFRELASGGFAENLYIANGEDICLVGEFGTKNIPHADKIADSILQAIDLNKLFPNKEDAR